MKAKVEWKPRDLVVGVYWKRTFYRTLTYRYRAVHVWVCLLPCIPIHLTFTREEEK